MNKFLPEEELEQRISRIREMAVETGYDAVLISTNANIYYTSGYVFSGFVYVSVDGGCLFFVHRPVGLEHEKVVYVSCDPATLARDVKYLRENGYEVRK